MRTFTSGSSTGLSCSDISNSIPRTASPPWDTAASPIDANRSLFQFTMCIWSNNKRLKTCSKKDYKQGIHSHVLGHRDKIKANLPQWAEFEILRNGAYDPHKNITADRYTSTKKNTNLVRVLIWNLFSRRWSDI